MEQIPGIRGAFLALINGWPAGSKPTVKDFLTTLSMPQMVVGSPETIARRLLENQAAGVDGIQVMNVFLPGTYDEFFEQVVPVLQEKGIMQSEYRPGVLRQKLFDADDQDISEGHPARAYRGAFAEAEADQLTNAEVPSA